MDKSCFHGKVAMITGAGSGIGQCTAIKLAKKGAKLALIDIDGDGLRTTVKGIENESSFYQLYTCDVTDTQSLRITFQEILKRFKKVDILINAAGIWESIPFLEMSEEKLDRMLDVNFYSCFRTIKLVLPQMIERRWGKVISLSSIVGKEGSVAGASHYAVSKAAIIILSRSLAKEFGSYNVTFNVVCPGSIETPMVNNIREIIGANNHEAVVKKNALKRIGQPEEVATAISFLASDGASFINGQSLNVCGGWRMD